MQHDKTACSPVEVEDFNELLAKHDAPGGVFNVVEGGRPESETHNVRHNNNDDPTDSRLGRQTNLAADNKI